MGSWVPSPGWFSLIFSCVGSCPGLGGSSARFTLSSRPPFGWSVETKARKRPKWASWEAVGAICRNQGQDKFKILFLVASWGHFATKTQKHLTSWGPPGVTSRPRSRNAQNKLSGHPTEPSGHFGVSWRFLGVVGGRGSSGSFGCTY